LALEVISRTRDPRNSSLEEFRDVTAGELSTANDPNSMKYKAEMGLVVRTPPRRGGCKEDDSCKILKISMLYNTRVLASPILP
jgi:hypothetical protein